MTLSFTFLFSLSAFKNLSLTFGSFALTCLEVFFAELIGHFLSFVNLYIHYLPWVWEVPSYFSWNKLSAPIFLSSLSGIHLPLYVALSNGVGLFLLYFFSLKNVITLSCSAIIISGFLSSSSLILSYYLHYFWFFSMHSLFLLLSVSTAYFLFVVYTFNIIGKVYPLFINLFNSFIIQVNMFNI